MAEEIIKLDLEKIKAAAEEGDEMALMLLDYETQELEIRESKQKGVYLIPGKTAIIQGDKLSLEQLELLGGTN